MQSLNALEIMTITPRLVSINIYRCYGSQEPGSKKGSIAYGFAVWSETNFGELKKELR